MADLLDHVGGVNHVLDLRDAVQRIHDAEQDDTLNRKRIYWNTVYGHLAEVYTCTNPKTQYECRPNVLECEIRELLYGAIAEPIYHEPIFTPMSTSDVWIATHYGKRGIGDKFAPLPHGSKVAVTYRHMNGYVNNKNMIRYQRPLNSQWSAWVVKISIPSEQKQDNTPIHPFYHLAYLTSTHFTRCSHKYTDETGVVWDIHLHVVPLFDLEDNEFPLFLSSPIHSDARWMVTNPTRTILTHRTNAGSESENNHAITPLYFSIRFTECKTTDEFIYMISGFAPRNYVPPKHVMSLGWVPTYHFPIVFSKPSDLQASHDRYELLHKLIRMFQLEFRMPCSSFILSIVCGYVHYPEWKRFASGSHCVFQPEDPEDWPVPRRIIYNEGAFVFQSLSDVLKPIGTNATDISSAAVRDWIFASVHAWCLLMWRKLVEEKVLIKPMIMSNWQDYTKFDTHLDSINCKRIYSIICQSWSDYDSSDMNGYSIYRLIERVLWATTYLFGRMYCGSTGVRRCMVQMTPYLRLITNLPYRVTGLIVEYAFILGPPDNDGDTAVIELSA